jgi:hypothetical protein
MESLLGFSQALFHPFAIRNVLSRPAESHFAPTGITLRFAADGYPTPTSIRADQLQISVGKLSCLPRLGDRNVELFPAFDGEQLSEFVV